MRTSGLADEYAPCGLPRYEGGCFTTLSNDLSSRNHRGEQARWHMGTVTIEHFACFLILCLFRLFVIIVGFLETFPNRSLCPGPANYCLFQY